MKTMSTTLIIGVLLALSCASQPVDLNAFNPENIPDNELVTVYVHGYCKVQNVDNIFVGRLPSEGRYRIFKIPPGIHTFYTRFDNGNAATYLPVPVKAQFEKGNMYLLSNRVAFSTETVTYHISLYNNRERGKEVTLELENEFPVSAYFNTIVVPALQGNSVKLENSKYLLFYKPDNLYALTDKETGITTEGSYVFPIDARGERSQINLCGKVFLFDFEIPTLSHRTWGFDQRKAQTIFNPIYVTETEIIYLCEKPLELRGTEITFSIAEIDKPVPNSVSFGTGSGKTGKSRFFP
ncbi:MAG: hypothetical protein LBG95_09690 [Treponema sp.]|jgi:hypothetical protein|nr:hypothetical protein [Treponema sp.]